MATKLDNILKGQLSDQLAEVYRVTSNGTRDYGDVRKALQNIIEGKFAPGESPRGVLLATSHQEYQPAWYVSPRQQLERVHQLNDQRNWGFEDSDFPSAPTNVNLRDGEVLLLCVYLPDQGRKRGLYRTIDELWNCSQAPTGYTKWRWDELKAQPKLIRQASDCTYTPGIRWVVFNPNAYQGKSPEQALELAKQDNVRLAGVEGLVANLLFPTWATSWDGKQSLYPWLGGLQFKYDSDWPSSLCLSRWDGSRQVLFSARWSGRVDSDYGSPSFRECKN